MAIDFGNGAVGAGGGILAVIVGWLFGRSDSAQKRRDDRTREVIELTVGKSLSEINGKIDALNMNMATFGSAVVKQSIESSATVIFETAERLIEIKKRD